MTRRGFSLTEVIVAAGIASVVLVGLFGALSHVTRGWRASDAGLERSQVAQRAIERLAEDFAHLDGFAKPTRTALSASGFEGEPVAFRIKPRAAAHVLNCYQLGTAAPEHSELHPFTEAFVLAGSPPEPAYDLLRSRWDERPPPSWIKNGIIPKSATEAAFVVKHPDEKPTVTWLALSLGRGVEPEQVLWTFAREKTGRVKAATILRHSSISGLWNMTKVAPMLGDVELKDQWLWVRSPKINGGEVFELLPEVELTAPVDPNLPRDPGYATRRTMTAGL